MARDYYDVLGVGRGAGSDEIQAAFRKLARRHHPDINKDPAAEERFREINEAYGVLSDPDTRRRYDRFGEHFRDVPEDYDERGRGGGGGGGGARGGGARPPRGAGGAGPGAEAGCVSVGLA
ncbi:DnaJ domain-containing protein, partial [Streptomyces sp. NPDC058992]|uniref:DnaJ domain-containing protein n=1 Tax=Streptomyces sp. NPDC058992 TaxID=3346688 RepID=UPI0036BE6C57